MSCMCWRTVVQRFPSPLDPRLESSVVALSPAHTHTHTLLSLTHHPVLTHIRQVPCQPEPTVYKHPEISAMLLARCGEMPLRAALRQLRPSQRSGSSGTSTSTVCSRADRELSSRGRLLLAILQQKAAIATAILAHPSLQIHYTPCRLRLGQIYGCMGNIVVAMWHGVFALQPAWVRADNVTLY